MAWKIVGLIESRGGVTTVLPEWSIGNPNNFTSHADAQTIRDAMANAVAKEKMTLRYVIVPAIDEALVAQLNQQQVTVAPTPQPSAQHPNFFGGPRRESQPA